MFPVRVRWGWFSIVWKARHGQSRPAGNGQRKSSCTCPWPRITGSARGGRGLSGPCLVPAQRGAGDRQAIPRRASSRLRSSATALPDRRLAGSLTFGSRCLFPSGVTSIFRVSLTGLSTPPFRRLFGLPLFFSFLFVVAAPNLPRPRGPDRVGSRLAAALPVPGSPARAGPRRAAGCSGGRVGGRCRWALLGPSAWTPVSGVSGGDARVQALLPGRARETFLRLALCFAREREPGAALRLPD